MGWSEFKTRVKAAFHREAVRSEAPPRPKPRHRALKWAGGIFLSLVAVVVLVLVFLDWNALRGPIGRYASARLHREVRILGDLNVKLFSWTPTAVVNDLVIAQPDWVGENAPTGTQNFANVQKLTVSLDLKRLLGWHLVLPAVAIEQPRLQFLRNEAGRANWDFDEDKNAKAFHLPPIHHFVIRDGRLDLNDAKKKLVFTGTISSEETAGASGQQFFNLTGKGTLNRAPFSAEVKGDPLLNIEPNQPYAFDAHVRAGETRIDAKGALNKPFDLGAFQVQASFAGPDLADLYYLTGLTLPSTRTYALSAHMTRDQDIITLRDFGGRVGMSDLHGEIRVDDSGDKPYLKADLISQKLSFDDLGPLIGARPEATIRTQTSPAKKDAPKPATLVLPDTPLHVERLRQMDADVRYRAVAVVSEDFPLRGAELQLSLKNGVLKITPVTFNFAHGTMKGNIAIDARTDVPVSDIDVRLTGLDLGQFLPPSGNMPSLAGEAIARAKLHGVGNSIHKVGSTASGTASIVVPHGQIRRAFAELLGINVAGALGLLLTNDQSQTDVRCAVAGFSAQNGRLTLNQFAFDTPVVLASGEGTVDLKNERMDLAITGHPKKPQLVRVRAPITVKGALDHPAVGVDAGSAIVQGGLSLGLAVVLSPLAALLPFVDPGLGKDADCGALLADARAKGTPVTTQQAKR